MKKIILLIILTLLSGVVFPFDKYLRIVFTDSFNKMVLSDVDCISHNDTKGTLTIHMHNGTSESYSVSEVEGIFIGDDETENIIVRMEKWDEFLDCNKTYSEAVINQQKLFEINDVIDVDLNDGILQVSFSDGMEMSKSYLDLSMTEADGEEIEQYEEFLDKKIDKELIVPSMKKIQEMYKNISLLKNKTVLIINGFAEDVKSGSEPSSNRYFKEVSALAALFQAEGFEVTIRNGAAVTTETYTEEMPMHGVTFIFSHGECNKNGYHFLQTGQKRNKLTYLTNDLFDKKYYMETSNDVGFQKICCENEFKKMRQFVDPNSQVLNFSCEALKDNNNVWEILKSKGLGGYWGYSDKVGIEKAFNTAMRYAENMLRGRNTGNTYYDSEWYSEYFCRNIENPSLIERRSMRLHYLGNKDISFINNNVKWLELKTFRGDKILLECLGLSSSDIISIEGAVVSGVVPTIVCTNENGIILIKYKGHLNIARSSHPDNLSSIKSFVTNDTIKSIKSYAFLEKVNSRSSSLEVFECAGVESLGSCPFAGTPLKRITLTGIKNIGDNHIIFDASNPYLEYISISGEFMMPTYGNCCIHDGGNLKEVKLNVSNWEVDEDGECIKTVLNQLKGWVYTREGSPQIDCEVCGKRVYEYKDIKAYLPEYIINNAINSENEYQRNQLIKLMGNGHNPECIRYKQQVFSIRDE